jgi:hypothetical protein
MGFVSLLQRVTPAHYAPTDRQTLIYLGVVAGTPIHPVRPVRDHQSPPNQSKPNHRCP